MKKQLLAFVFLFSIQTTYGQVNDSLKTKSDSIVKTQPAAASTKKDNRPLKDRIDFGFGSSFWFTAYQTYIEVAPVLAYRFPKTLVTGVGYRYIWRRELVQNQDLNAYGPDFFARINLIPKIYMWTEYEILYNEYLKATLPGNENIVKDKTTSTAWFAGLGYMKSVGRKGRGGISLQVLYNFLYENDDIYPYYAPVTYRVGYFF